MIGKVLRHRQARTTANANLEAKTPRETLEAETATLEAHAAELTAAIEGRTAAKADPLARRAAVARQLDAEGTLVRQVLSRGPARAATGR